MRVRAIRTFSSHILSKNKTVLLGQTALRLWLYNLISNTEKNLTVWRLELEKRMDKA